MSAFDTLGIFLEVQAVTFKEFGLGTITLLVLPMSCKPFHLRLKLPPKPEYLIARV